MKTGVLLFIGSFLIPNFAFAVEDISTCSRNGYTIATINGIFTTKKEAEKNMIDLRNTFGLNSRGQGINYDYLHNESHIGGLGDILKAAYQGIFDDETVKDYDLVEMIRAASEKVKTQKLLLVAHSQGNFYANSFYDYIKTTEATRNENTEQTPVVEQSSLRGTERNASPLSIGVYSVATPAGRVAGGGKWLTSDTDKVIAGVVGHVLSRNIMKPNAHIELGAEDEALGHNFGSVYLKYEGARIISDIESALDKLRAFENPPPSAPPLGKEELSRPCIAAPELTVGHKVAGMAFTLADPLATAGRTVVGDTIGGIYKVGLAVGNAGKAAMNTLADIFTADADQTAAVATAGADSSQFSSAEDTPDLLSSEQRSDVLENIRTSEGADTKQTVSEQRSVEQATTPPEEKNPPPAAPTRTIESFQSGEPPLPKEEQKLPTDDLPSVTPHRLSPPGGGGGGVTNPARMQTDADSTQTSADATTLSSPAADTTAPSSPMLTSPANNATLTATSVNFTGTAEASSTISTDFSSATTSASGGSAWTLTLSLSQGTTTLAFYATDAAGNRSNAASTTVFVDSLAPAITLSDATECADSLVSGSCFVATTTLSFSWLSSSSDLSYFALDKNGVFSTTTPSTSSGHASTTVVAPDQSTYSFGVVAVDRFGNTSATSTQTVTVHTLPVVINEVAWAGTQGSSADEWIELYNRTSQNLSLSNWKLYTDDFSPYLSLSGSIAPNSYYLIERKNTGETNEATQSSVTDITADLWTSFGFGLNNNGENLFLVFTSAGRATTTIDSKPTCSGSNAWCGGSSSNYTTVERYDTSVAGTVTTNWYSHMSSTNNMSTSVKNGTDAGGNAIRGTPRARNSVSYLIDPSHTFPESKTLTAAQSPYLVDRFNITVPTGKTLTIDPGVVIKITGSNEPWIRIAGTINANGTAASPVVFTSFYDDEYGGDINGDATSTTPAAANWRRILIDTTSTGSSFTHTLVRYGGNNDISDPAAYKGAIGVDSATVLFSNLAVEKSGFHGLALQNSNSTVSNSRFATSTNSSRSGLYVSGGAPTVSGSTFSGNYRGAMLESTTASLSSNTFTGNTQEAVYATGNVGSFSGNVGSGNGMNAIVFEGSSTITSSGATTTLSANALPYLLKGVVMVAGNSTLSFEQGVVVKGYDGVAGNFGEIIVSNGGKLHWGGAMSTDLVFTSVGDTSVGGATVSGRPAPGPGNWNGITVEAGGVVDLTGFTMRYAGQRAGAGLGEAAGGIKITGSAATSSGTISQALFESNYQSGLNLANVSALSVSDVTFHNHTQKQLGSASGIYALTSTSTLSNISFSNNEKDAIGVGTNVLSCSNCGSPNTTPANLFGP